MTPTAYRPIAIADIDLDGDVPGFSPHNAQTGTSYGAVFCLVRKSGRPIGIVEIPLADREVPPEEMRARLSAVAGADPGPPPQRPAQMPPASVVIATRDRAASLATCLDSILRQDYPSFDVIVVDNAPSSNETANLIAERYSAGGKVRYVREDRPGLGRAHNAGLEQVTAPVVAFTDDDVVADRRWLAALCQNFDDAGRTGCVTGLILPAELETRAQYWTEKHGGFGKGFTRKVFDLGKNRPEGPLFPFTAGQFGSGASMAFRSSALREIGGFDPALGAGTPARGGDDLASFFAIIQAGYQLVYEPEAIVWHHHRRGEEGMRRQAFGYGMGLGAYLTKTIIDNPMNALRLAIAFPAGVRHMIGPSSAKTRRLPDDYPSALVWQERLGILNGVPGYIRSLRAKRRAEAPGKPMDQARALRASQWKSG
jgi:GT2 family glycosyltransferase